MDIELKSIRFYWIPDKYFFSLLHPNRRITSKPESQHSLITYERRSLHGTDFPRWDESTKSLPRLHIDWAGSIENEGKGMLQVKMKAPLLQKKNPGKEEFPKYVRSGISFFFVLSCPFTFCNGAND